MDAASPTRRENDLTALLKVAEILGATSELIPLLEQVAEAAISVLDCERATVFLYDGAKHELYSLVATGVESIRFNADLGIAGESIREGTAINVPDAYADQRFNQDIDRATGFRTRNLLTLPMRNHQGELVGVLQMLNKRETVFGPDDEESARTLSSLAGVAIQRQMLLDEYAAKQKLESDLDLARTIQQSLLPPHPPQVEGFDIAGFNRPADATGGDCYDYLTMPGGRIGFVLADATGHGIGPALLVSRYHAMLRALCGPDCHPLFALERVNTLLLGDIPDGMFITSVVGVVDISAQAIHYVSAGQGPLLVYRRAADECIELPADTFPLGITGPLDCEPAAPVVMTAGDVMLLMTDGFFEWADPDGRQYGAARVFDVVRAHPDRPAAELIELIRQDLSRFARGTDQLDDLTAIVIRKL